jgi:hypothetical protein
MNAENYNQYPLSFMQADSEAPTRTREVPTATQANKSLFTAGLHNLLYVTVTVFSDYSGDICADRWT